MRKALRIVAAICVAGTTLSAGASEWVVTRPLRMSGYVPVFTALTPSGDLVVSTFNSIPRPGIVQLPVVLVHKPLGPDTRYFVVCTESFDSMRGYSGVAVDADGNFFVAADPGDGNRSWIRKFRPDGKPDTGFGSAGEIRTGKRMLGLDVTGRYLVTTAAFAELMVFDRNNGQLIGAAPKPQGTVTIRDVAVNPSGQTVFGVGEGGIWVWEGGSLDNPAGYRMRQLSPKTGEARAGEGIAFDGASQRALVPDSRSGELIAVNAAGDIRRSTISNPTPNYNSLADAVLLQDGRTLLVTDMALNSIYVMTRTETPEQAAAASTPQLPRLEVQPPPAMVAGTTPPPAPATPVPALAPMPGPVAEAALPPPPATGPAQPAPTAPPATQAELPPGLAWITSYDEALARARAESKPLLLYARASGVLQCDQLETGLLRSPQFVEAAAGYVPCFLDVTQNRQTAQQLGFFKVPVIAIYSSSGERLGVYTGQISPGEVMTRLKDLAPKP